MGGSAMGGGSGGSEHVTSGSAGTAATAALKPPAAAMPEPRQGRQQSAGLAPRSLEQRAKPSDLVWAEPAEALVDRF